MLVTGIHDRHPAVLANMAATLDIVSGGRLELGIGAGWNELESGAYGIELGTPRQRSDRFAEACELLTGLLSPQQATTFRGRFYRLEAARCNPKPVQQPHPPICIGGTGERRTCAPRPGSPSTGTSRAGPWSSLPGRGMRCISTAQISAVRRPGSCCPARCGSPATRPGRPPRRRPPAARRRAGDRLSAVTAHSGRAGAAGRRTVGTVLNGWLAAGSGDEISGPLAVRLSEGRDNHE
jgi:hypothetical protein